MGVQVLADLELVRLFFGFAYSGRLELHERLGVASETPNRECYLLGSIPQQPETTQIKSQRPWTARVSSAIDDMARQQCTRGGAFEANFRQPRADPLEFGP